MRVDWGHHRGCRRPWFCLVGSIYARIARRQAALKSKKSIFDLQKEYFSVCGSVFTITLELICHPLHNVCEAVELLI